MTWYVETKTVKTTKLVWAEEQPADQQYGGFDLSYETAVVGETYRVPVRVPGAGGCSSCNTQNITVADPADHSEGLVFD
jgi:hypothetical protein